MLGAQLATARDHDPIPLSPRAEETLDGLLAGLSEKEIADQMGLSPHTVHQYVKELHRRYGVRSRGELMALWIRRSARRS